MRPAKARAAWLSALTAPPHGSSKSCLLSTHSNKIGNSNYGAGTLFKHGDIWYISFNGPGRGGALRLRDGAFYQWDGGERDKNNRKPDWETTIEQDVLLLPTGSDAIRVIVLNQVHRTGTGSFRYVFAFQCDADSLKKVVEGSGEGVKLERADRNGMDITVGVWRDDDPHCCPGRQEHLRYRWVPSLKHFVREPSRAACPWLP